MIHTKIPTDRSLARRVLQTEAAAILAVVDRLYDSFDRAVRMVVVAGGAHTVAGVIQIHDLWRADLF
jgi:hypothetical protein